MPKAIVIDQPGGADVMQWRDVPMPEPGEGEVLIRQTAVGLNYVDTLHRSGVIPLKSYPGSIGVEGSGVVEKLGPGCELGFKEGDEVCYAGGSVGAYSQYRTLAERWLVRVPDKLSKELAAAIMVKGITAYCLARRTFYVDEHTTMLVHAAAGGVGSFLCQWGRMQGATVIGTVSTEEKAKLATECGCQYIIYYDKENVVERVREITEGRGCNVVYDSVGAATFDASLDCLMPFGCLVSYGEASGPVPPVSLGLLQSKGSLLITRPRFEDYVFHHPDYVLACSEVMGALKKGALKINVKQSYYLRDAARAHREMESRNTLGTTIFYTEA